MENRKKEKQEKSKQEYKAVFLFPFEEITYLSYCIRDNPLKEKKLCAETWLFLFLLISYCSTAIYQHQKIKIMTYKEANNISIKDYLNSLGIQPVTEKGSYGM